MLDNILFFKKECLNKINIPLTLFEFLDEKYFNILDERGSKVCTKVITGEQTKKIVCKKDFRNYLNLTSHYIFLFINKGSFRINLDDMFWYELQKFLNEINFCIKPSNLAYN